MEIIHDKSDKGPIINIEGEKGESLFRRPVIWFIEGDFQRIKEQYESYQKLIEGAKEERLLAIIGALSMEEALDLFLGSYLPDYSNLEENRDFSLSMKIDLAHSLRLIPKHILNTADLIRSVRNKFAHNLNIICFGALDRGTKDSLGQKYRVFFPDDVDTGLTVKDMFVSIVEAVIVGLAIYASHLRAAKEFIHSEDFSGQLVKRIKAESG